MRQHQKDAKLKRDARKQRKYERGFEREIMRRIRDFERGNVPTYTMEEVKARLSAKLQLTKDAMCLMGCSAVDAAEAVRALERATNPFLYHERGLGKSFIR